MNRINNIHTNRALGLGAAVATLFLGLLALSSAASANEANLTRFGPEIYTSEEGRPTSYWATFKAIDGPAELVLRDDGVKSARIEINGHNVVRPRDFRGDGKIILPIHLNKENTIEVSVRNKHGKHKKHSKHHNCGGVLGVRVTQFTEADIKLTGFDYFGLNTSNMDRQRAFYDLLGFEGEIFPAGPETSETFARSLGFLDDYLIFVALHSIEAPAAPPFIDTVQFRDFSYRDDPPYTNLNHIGMAYGTLSTTDLDGDYEYLQSAGVEFVSPPTTAPNGERFVFMKDQDGTFLKLIETSEGEGPTSGPDLVKIVNTNMNVVDLERSREFYRLLGFTESVPASQAGGGDFASAHGFDGEIAFKGVDVSLAAGPDVDANGATIQLRQWRKPYDTAPPYSPPVNHLGIDRIAFFVADLTATIKTMNELGFEQLGPVGGGVGFGIVFFYDPDGIKVEFAGPIP